MPYIQQKHRPPIDAIVEQLAEHIISSYEYSGASQLDSKSKQISVMCGTREGDLNYAITKLLLLCYPNAKYAEYNAAYGMLQCCADEYYRKIIAPYLDEK